MKKLLGLICAFVFFVLPVSATDTTEWTTENGLARVEKIGKNLL